MALSTRATRLIAIGGTWLLCAGLVAIPLSGVAAAAPALPTGDLLIENADFEAGAPPADADDEATLDLEDASADSPSSGALPDLAGWSVRCSPGADVTPVQQAGSLPGITVAAGKGVDGSRAAALSVGDECAAPLARSAPLPATPKERYTAFVTARSGDGENATGIAAGVALVFLDANKKLIHRTASATSTDPAWNVIRMAAAAPAKAAYVAVEVSAAATPETSSGTAYFDATRLSRRMTDLGPQLTTTYVRATTFGTDKAGRPVVYAVTDGGKGVPAKLSTIDIETATLVRSVPLNAGSPSGSWAAITASDGTVYVASYQPGMLWAYRPGAAKATRVALIRGDQIPFGLAAGTAGSVYFGGYPDAIVYRYIPGKGAAPFVDAKKLTKQTYVRSLAVDPTTRTLYVGVGTKAGVLACDERTATCNALAGSAFRGQQFAYQLAAAPGKLFAYLSPSNSLAAFDITVQPDGTRHAKATATVPAVSYPGASPAFDGAAYYRDANSWLMRIDLATGARTKTGAVFPGPRSFGQATLADQTRFPGSTVLAAATFGDGIEIAGYNPQTGATFRSRVSGLPGSPVGLQTLGRGPDGAIYSSGYPSGGLAAYPPMRADQAVQQRGIGQAEGITALGDALYLGVYPNAQIQRLTPGAPIAPKTNPATVCSAAPQKQDRPYAMATGGGKLYIGTMAGYGQLPGALTIYDPASGRCTVKRNVVPNQSIVSLAYDDTHDVLYGGSLVWGGLGAKPAQVQARLLIYYPKTGTSRTVALPVHSTSLQGLTIGPDGNLWMMAQNTLLLYSLDKRVFIAQRPLFTDRAYPRAPLNAVNRVTAYDASLVVAGDGNVYGTMRGRFFFRIDAKTKKAAVLYRGSVSGATTDEYGNVYFINGGDRLIRFVP